MNIDFNDVHLQARTLRAELDRAVGEVLSRGVFILGPEVNAFEQEFAAYCGARHGIGVASGLDALTLTLRALGVGRGDEVIVPALSAAATALAVTAVGARPAFADVSAGGFTLDPEAAASSVTSRTRAVIPVHLYGMPARSEELRALGLPLVEDAAQAHGSASSDGRCPTAGIAAAFSFYPTKNLGAYGDGGMIVTDDRSLANSLRLLRNYGQSGHYASEIEGVNSRLDELQAAMLRVKLGWLDRWNERRRQIARIYRTGLQNVPVTLQQTTGTTNNHLFVIQTHERDELRSFLATKEIPTLVHYPIPLHRQKAFAAYDPNPCPNADKIANEVLSLPIHGHMETDQADFVVHCIREFFKQASWPRR